MLAEPTRSGNRSGDVNSSSVVGVDVVMSLGEGGVNPAELLQGTTIGATTTDTANPPAATASVLVDPAHQTRRRTNSIVKRPRHLDSPEPMPVPSTSSTNAFATSTSPKHHSTTSPSRRLSFTSASPPSIPSSHTLPTPSTSGAISSSLVIPPSRGINLAKSVSNSEPYVLSAADKRKHPRELVPLDIGFPTPDFAGRIRKEDSDDRLLMATCAVLYMHGNRALCPKEMAEVMFEKKWLHNAGTTPFAHVSTCIRSHLRRATTSVPPYAPLVTSFELVGILTPAEVAAVGLVSEDKPAVKRGTLWYLDERVLGKGKGVEDPFIRYRREAGLPPSEKDGIYLRNIQPNLVPAVALVPIAIEEEEDDTGMGRGKRKRRASGAMGEGLGLPAASTSPLMPIAITIPSVPSQSRRGSHPTIISSSLPSNTKFTIPRLRLRLTNLEEVDSDFSDGQTSDAIRRRETRKKARKGSSKSEGARAAAASRMGSGGVAGEIGSAGSSGSSSGESEDDRELEDRRRYNAFSSASSSALLAQSLLAASTSTPSLLSRTTTTHHSVISPNSLHYTTASPHNAPHRTHHHLSLSAPNIFTSSFSSSIRRQAGSHSHSPDPMDIIAVESTEISKLEESDEADEDDFHEAMLRGEDFDFEWGSESYTMENSPALLDDVDLKSHAIVSTFPSMNMPANLEAEAIPLSIIDIATPSSPASLSIKPEFEPEASISLLDPFDLDLDLDLADGLEEASTPATTPRSPAAKEEDFFDSTVPLASSLILNAAAFCGGMEDTLCGAFAQDISQDLDEEKVEVRRMIDRATSTDSLTSFIDDEDVVNQTPTARLAVVDASTLSLPLPSPLALELPPMLSLNSGFSPDYDFVGHEEDDRSAYRNQYHDRDGAESADDEDDEEDDIVEPKLEEEDGSMGDENSSRSSRQSSAYPIESFRRVLKVGRHSSSISSAGSDSDEFDPHMIVSSSLLASGLPVPQSAPSPPMESAEWGMHLDLDDIDIELGSGHELLGPESVGLEELDIAWGGPAEQGEDETDEDWRVRQLEAKDITRGCGRVEKASTFLTGSPIDCFSPILAARKSISSSLSSLPALPLPPTLLTTLLSPPLPLSATLSSSVSSLPPSSASASPSVSTTPMPRHSPVPIAHSTHQATPSVVVYPSSSLTPTVTATITLGVPVFSTTIVDSRDHMSYPFLRRMDTNAVNGTTLLRPTSLSLIQREQILTELLGSGAYVVLQGGPAVEGTWITLGAARHIKNAYRNVLGTLEVFLEDDLASKFPAPIPAMRHFGGNKSFSCGEPPVHFPIHSSNVGVLSKALSVPTAAKVRAKGRRKSVKAEVRSSDEEPEVIPVRRSRRN